MLVAAAAGVLLGAHDMISTVGWLCVDCRSSVGSSSKGRKEGCLVVCRIRRYPLTMDGPCGMRMNLFFCLKIHSGVGGVSLTKI